MFLIIFFFDHSTLASPFRKQHNNIMHSQRRGFGYWIWKPHVIEMALETASPADVAIYLDAELILNTRVRNRLLEYIDTTLDSPGKMLSFQNIHTKHRWTRADLAKRLGVLEKPRIMSTSQLSSGFILLGNTGSNGDLVRERKKVALEKNYHYSDGYSF
jgi:hypothetical protein